MRLLVAVAIVFAMLTSEAPAASADTIVLTGGDLNFFNDASPAGGKLIAPGLDVGIVTGGFNEMFLSPGTLVDFSGHYPSLKWLNPATVDDMKLTSPTPSSSGGRGLIWTDGEFDISAVPVAVATRMESSFSMTGTIFGWADTPTGPAQLPLFTRAVAGKGTLFTGGELINFNFTPVIRDVGISFRFEPQAPGPSPTPEPATILLIAAGSAAYFNRRRK